MEFPDVEEANEYLRFLGKFFPEARFIFNERNVKDTAKSGWWANDAGAEKSISDLLRRMKIMYEANKDKSYWLSYDDYKENPLALSGLFGFLEEDFDVDVVSKIMSKRHSY